MKRISSIDSTRGIVMIIMALDHVRDFMHTTALTQSPTNLQTTTAALFFTRWITYLCAPTFVFLSGVSAYTSFKKNNNIKQSRNFLLTRGLWLILLEFTVINFALWFDVQFRMLIMEVICAIGFGFIVLSFMLKLRLGVIAIAGVLIIFAHDLLQNVSFPGNTITNLFYSALFRPNLIKAPSGFTFVVGYPLVPWLGILLTGFACGKLFELSLGKRKKVLLQIGIGALSLFCLARFINIYGDPVKWAVQKTSLFTFLSFINTTKYPPSLLFSLMILGIMFLILSVVDNMNNRFTGILSVYGKVPLFYFIVHLYVIHTIMFAMLYVQGFGLKDLQFGVFNNGRPLTGSGVELPAIYLVWMSLVIFLYPLCKWYGRYKESHKENKLLRYL